MKEIPLTQGKVALVDDEDYEYLMQWKWFVRRVSTGYHYAARWDIGYFPRRHVHMHREILLRASGLLALVDHIDGDGLNNQRYNLRAADKSQNSSNHRVNRNNTSGAIGISWRPRQCLWYAHIRLKGRRVSKRFKDFDEAVVWRDAKAKELHGEFAVLNRG
jgi:hypothetical protein